MYLNIELGAGCGNFGKIFYPTCCLTDKDKKLIEQNCGQMHNIDYFVDAEKISTWASYKFEKVIICNPYGYGFKDKAEGSILIGEMVNVLFNEGQIIIISSSRNSYCLIHKIKNSITEFNQKNPTINLVLENETIDASVEYPGYKFYQCDHTQAIPNQKITINVKH